MFLLQLQKSEDVFLLYKIRHTFFVNRCKILVNKKRGGGNNKDYNITFTGTMESYYGHLPCMDPVCDFSFIIHFRNNLQDIDNKMLKNF